MLRLTRFVAVELILDGRLSLDQAREVLELEIAERARAAAECGPRRGKECKLQNANCKMQIEEPPVVPFPTIEIAAGEFAAGLGVPITLMTPMHVAAWAVWLRVLSVERLQELAVMAQHAPDPQAALRDYLQVELAHVQQVAVAVVRPDESKRLAPSRN